MYIFRALIIILLIAGSAQARKPAVEDFVGVETQDYTPTTPGSEVLFNFNNSMQQENSSVGSELFTFLFILSFLSLPFFMWLGLTRTKPKSNSASTIEIVKHTSTIESTTKAENNVEYLSDYKEEEDKAS